MIELVDEEEIRTALEGMEDNPSLVTDSAFRANAEKWPENTISFVDRHLEYLRQHPKTDPQHYLSNLRLRLRKRP